MLEISLGGILFVLITLILLYYFITFIKLSIDKIKQVSRNKKEFFKEILLLLLSIIIFVAVFLVGAFIIGLIVKFIIPFLFDVVLYLVYCIEAFADKIFF